ncbi:MAG: LapA family protein [Desulfobacterales bacterium]|nr:LapA family protein [Desulfobacterales bacterium]
MKKTKIAFWALIIGFFALIILQNKPFFLDKQDFRIDLFFWNYNTPTVSIAILFAAFFVAGLLIAYFFSLSGRFKSNRTIKTLNATLDAQRAELDAMKKQVEGLRPAATDPVVDPVAGSGSASES